MCHINNIASFHKLTVHSYYFPPQSHLVPRKVFWLSTTSVNRHNCSSSHWSVCLFSITFFLLLSSLPLLAFPFLLFLVFPFLPSFHFFKFSFLSFPLLPCLPFHFLPCSYFLFFVFTFLSFPFHPCLSFPISYHIIFLSFIFSLLSFFVFYFLSFTFLFLAFFSISTFPCLSFCSLSFLHSLSSNLFAPVIQAICPSISRAPQMDPPLRQNIRVFLPAV